MKIMVWIAGLVFATASFAEERGMTITITEDHWSVEEGDPPYTVGEVKALYGSPDGVRTNEHSMDLVYSNAGVFFVCFSLEADSRINEMVVWSPFKLRTTDGIVLGKSTAGDAEKTWGEIKWYGRSDFPEYGFFRRHAVRCLVPRNSSPPSWELERKERRKRRIERMILPYYALKRLEYIEPVPIEIKADAVALKVPPTDLEGYLGQVFIETLDLDLDADKDPDWNSIWENFANRPYERQFTSMSNENWFENRKRFEAELLKQAREGKYDWTSLQQILDSIRPKQDDRTAWIPVCAFRARKGAEPVWIVVTKWEHAGQSTPMRLKDNWKLLGDDEDKFEAGEPKWSSLGHIRIEVFRISDGELVDGTQCG